MTLTPGPTLIGWKRPLIDAAASTKLPRGDEGVDRTIAAMIALAHEGATDPLVRSYAAAIQAHGPGRVYELYDWLRRRFAFRRDIRGVEHVREPRVLLMQAPRMQGDCDDLATLAAALLLAMGERPVFIVMARRAGGNFEHVFYGIIRDRKVIPFDPQERIPPGHWHERIGRLKVYAV